MEVEIVTFVVKGSSKLTVTFDRQEQIQVQLIIILRGGVSHDQYTGFGVLVGYEGG